MKVADLPHATPRELNTLPEGLYVVCRQLRAGHGKGKVVATATKHLYDVSLDRFVTGDAVLMARILPAGSVIPNGVELSEIRRDGKVRIQQWMLIEDLERRREAPCP